MTVAPIKLFPAWKTPSGSWCGTITQDGTSQEGGGTAICVVYGGTQIECENRIRILHAALREQS